MYSKVRTSVQDPFNANMEKLQVTQNKLARVLENVNLKDTDTAKQSKNALSKSNLSSN